MMRLERLAWPPAPPCFHVPESRFTAPDPAEVPPPLLLLAVLRLQLGLSVEHMEAPCNYQRWFWGPQEALYGGMYTEGFLRGWHRLDDTYYYPVRHPRLSGMPIPVRLLPSNLFHPIARRILLFLDNAVCPCDLLDLLTSMSIRLSVARWVASGL